MVIDDVEDDGDPMAMGGVDEGAEIVGRAVKPGRREEVDAVVAPAEATGKIGHRHLLDHRNAETGKLPKLSFRRLPRAFRGKCPDMHLVDDLSLDTRAVQSPSLHAKRAGSMTFDGPWGPSGWQREAGSG